MPGYLYSFQWLKTLWPLLVVTGLVSLGVWTGYLVATARALASRTPSRVGNTKTSEKTQETEVGAPGKALLVIFSFSMLGITIGWLTGDSGQQVLASVLPAVLTLIGGLAVFLVGKQLQDANMIAAALLGLTLNLLVGALLASENDLNAKEHAREQSQQNFQAQVGPATGLNTQNDVANLAAKIQDQIQVKDKAGQ